MWILSVSALKSDSMGRLNDQDQDISPRYARKRESIFIIMQFIRSILWNIVYVHMLHRMLHYVTLCLQVTL